MDQMIRLIQNNQLKAAEILIDGFPPNIQESIHMSLIKLKIYILKQEFDEAKTLIGKLKQKINPSISSKDYFCFLVRESSLEFKLRNIEKGKEILYKAKSIYETEDILSEEISEYNAEYYVNFGFLHLISNNLKDANYHLSQSTALYRKLNYSLDLAYSLNNLAVAKIKLNEKPIAISFLQEALCIYENLPDCEQYLGLTLNNIGGIAHEEGNLLQAKDLFLKSLSFNKKSKNDLQIAKNLNNLGAVSFLLGHDDEALAYYLESIDLKNKINEKSGLYFCYHNLGSLLRRQGKLKDSIDYFLKALDLLNNDNDSFEFANTSNEIMLSYYDIGNLESVKKHFDNIQAMANKMRNPRVYLIQQVSKGIYLKESPTLAFQLSAIQVLRSVIISPIDFQEIKIYALINYLELIFRLTKWFNNEYLSVQIHQVTNVLYKFAQQQSSVPLIIDVLILKAKLKAIDDEYESGIEILYQAELLAEETELSAHLDRIYRAKNVIIVQRKKTIPATNFLEKLEEFEFVKCVEKISSLFS